MEQEEEREGACRDRRESDGERVTDIRTVQETREKARHS